MSGKPRLNLFVHGRGHHETASTEPHNPARQLASLDHISKGRIGWNIVASWVTGAGPNFGYDRQIEHAGRCAWATRFRRLAKDYERYASTLADLHIATFACIRLKQAAQRAKIHDSL